MKRLFALASVLFSGSALAQVVPGTCLVSATCINAASCELTAPTHSDGDLLVAFAVANDSTFTGTLRINEAGWTTRAFRNATGGADRSILVSTKFASSEAGTYTLDTVEGAAATVEWKAFICPFANVHADVLDAATVYASDVTDNDAIDPAAITTATANALVVTALGAGNSGGSDLTHPSGHTELLDEIGGGTIWVAGSYLNVVSPGSSDPAAWSGMTATADSSVATLAFKAATGPEFSVAPAESTNTTTTILFTYAATNATNICWALRNSGTSAYADYAAVVAASGAIDADCEPVSADVLVPWVFYEGDIDFALDGPGGTSAVSTLNDRVRNVPAGYAASELGTLSGTSPLTVPVDAVGDCTDGSPTIAGMADTTLFAVETLILVSDSCFASAVVKILSKTATSITADQNAATTVANVDTTGYVTPAGAAIIAPVPATGDWLIYKQASDIGGTLVVDGSWDFDFTPDSGEGALLTALEVLPQDVSDSTPEYAAPLNGFTGAAFEFLLNEPTPVCDIEALPRVLPVGTPISSIDMDAICTHPRTLTVAVRAGHSLLTGLSLGSNNITGTVAAETDVESPSAVQFWFYSGVGRKTALATWTVWAIDTVPMPSIDGGTLSAATAALEAARPWLTPGTGYLYTEICTSLEAEGEVLNQNPAAAAEITASEVVSFVASSGPCPSSGGGFIFKRRRPR
jgi:hypothetical protein